MKIFITNRTQTLRTCPVIPRLNRPRIAIPGTTLPAPRCNRTALPRRRSDVVAFGRQHVKEGWITFTQAKNRNRKPVTLSIPVRPELKAIVEATPSGNLTFLVTAFNKPFTANGFGNWFRDRCNEAGLPHCSAHGLRKAAASRLAELGAGESEIMAITGHTTSKEVVRYTRGARQKVLAAKAMARFDEDKN